MSGVSSALTGNRRVREGQSVNDVNLSGRCIAVLGMGIMGRSMVRNLARAGAEVVVWNRTIDTARQMAGGAIRVVATPAQAARTADIRIIVVADSQALADVVLGSEGVLAGLNGRGLVIDMGTSSVNATHELAAQVAAAGGEYLDAPVSGGERGASAATLSIMVGGSELAYATALPILQALGQNIRRIGKVGAGQVAKAANQIIVGLTIEAVAEALALARAAGVDPARVREVLAGGFADSRILHLHGQRMLEGDYSPGGRALTQRKDLELALALAADCGLELPATSLCRERYDELIAAGKGDCDHSALAVLYPPLDPGN